MRHRPPVLLLGLALALLATRRAGAHLVSTELGPFYDGAAHPLVTVEDLLAILVLALFAGLGGPRRGRHGVLALAGGWALGALAVFGAGLAELQLGIWTAVVLVVAGVAVAANFRLPDAAVAVIAAILGLAHGASNGAAAHADGARWLAVVGIATGVLVLAVTSTGFSVRLAQRGAPIVLRVAGSWIGAIALLKLGWALQAA